MLLLIITFLTVFPTTEIYYSGSRAASLITILSFGGKESAEAALIFLWCWGRRGRWGSWLGRPVFWIFGIDWWFQESVRFCIGGATWGVIQIHRWLAAPSVYIGKSSAFHLGLIWVSHRGSGFVLSEPFTLLTPLTVRRSHVLCLWMQRFQLLA